MQGLVCGLDLVFLGVYMPLDVNVVCSNDGDGCR